MGRGERPAKAKVEARSAVAGKSQPFDGSTWLQLEQRLAEASAQHAAISQILQVISASPGDVQPVLHAVAERAALLCQAPLARVLLVDGYVLRAMAEYSFDGTTQERTPPLPLKRTTITGRAVLDRATIHHDDVVPLLDSEYPDALNARSLGLRAVLAVPLMREGNAYGAILLFRREPRAFSSDQVALVETFAQQAAIAIENVRLFNETKEALEQQTATSEILRVISQSPTDVQPVFETIAAAALKLCRASSGNVFTFDGELIHLAALVSSKGADAIREAYPRPPGRDTGPGRAVMTRGVVVIPDVLSDAEYAIAPTAIAGGFGSILAVPLLREGHPIGAITVGRPEPGPFRDQQIALLQTFADQAVIAIENVRLFKETKEALEQQTATAEILQAISSSPGNLQPVLDILVRAAARFCGAPEVLIMRLDDGVLRSAAGVGSYADAVKRKFGHFEALTLPLTKGSVAGRALLERRTIHVNDLAVESEDEYPEGLQLQRQFGSHTVVATPLLREGVALGTIALVRMEVKPFSDRQIQLLRAFADQAVIAIENVRLFDEVQARTHDLTESLQQQTATADVLKVISRSTFDLQTVLDTLTESACKLCEADASDILRPDGDVFKVAAMFGQSPAHKAALKQLVIRPGRDTCAGRTLLEGRTVHIRDAALDPEYNVPDVLNVAGNRAMLGVPLLREGAPIGVLVLTRSLARPFTEKQIALATTFADQAVIAIENVRLFNETTEALEHQTATGEILRVISSSPTDVQPVFEIISSRAGKLCDAEISVVSRVDGEQIHLAAIHGVTEEARETIRRLHPMPLSMETATARAIRGRGVVHISDVMDDPLYGVKDAATVAGWRGSLAVPMLREGQVIGAIFVARRNPGLFADSKIELLETFADQAVIAIENVRLFTELKARTTQLTQSVGELRALGEVGQAVSSTLDLETVLSTIVSRATALAGMDAGAIYEYDEVRGEFYLHTADRLPDEVVTALRAGPIPKGEGALGRMAITGDPTQIHDIMTDASYQSRLRGMFLTLGYRSLMAVPLTRDDHLLGGLVVYRKTPGEFDASVIDLLKTFATQSALAIQNARLFRVIEQKSRELEAASHHKSEFLANMSHELRTPLNAIIGFSEVLSERMFGEVNEKQAEYIGDILESGRHLLSLINDILDLSKIEAGRMELEPTDFTLSSAIENALTLVKERAHRRGIVLVGTVDERLGMIHADERKVKQVLLNLLSNALKFTPEAGRIDVRATVRNGTVEISVTDTGVGIAPEDQETVFEEFRQVGTAAKKVEGTGLGLAISRKFIELHGGKIWVESQVGKGSTFAFTLPLQ